jgi:hypothetical protein
MAFSNNQIQQIWKKGLIIPGYNPNKYRRDSAGEWMERSEYGNKHSEFGWKIIRIIPKSEGGTDELSNLEPMSREAIAAKAYGLVACGVV